MLLHSLSCALAIAALGDFTPSGTTTYADLSTLIRRQSPSVEGVRGAVEEAQANLRQTQLYENPLLMLGVHQIPLGSTNPPGLRLFDQVMAYGADLGYRIELGKRGARQAREGYTLRSEQALMFHTARARALDLARALGALAVATLKDGIAKRRLEAERTQLGAAGGGPATLPAVELGRLELDAFRLEQQSLSEQSDAAAALAACAELIAAPCNPFADDANARAFLEHWLDEPADDLRAPLESRWDLRALDTARRAADEDLRLGDATAIPDPTLRVGYLHDRLTIAGHQLNTLSVTVSIPLPLFEQGQAHSQAAAARSARLKDTRERSLRAGKERLGALGNQLALQKRRRDLLGDKALPRAKQLLDESERALAAHVPGLGLGDVLALRRALDELSMAQADALFASFDATVDVLRALPDPTSTQ